MREAPANPLLEALRQAIGFEPIGDPVGNATVGRGNFRGSAVHAALIESRTASGSIGDAEATRLGALLRSWPASARRSSSSSIPRARRFPKD